MKTVDPNSLPNAPFTYFWYPGEATTRTVSNLAPGWYNVTVNDKDGTGCSQTAKVFVGDECASVCTDVRLDIVTANDAIVRCDYPGIIYQYGSIDLSTLNYTSNENCLLEVKGRIKGTNDPLSYLIEDLVPGIYELEFEVWTSNGVLVPEENITVVHPFVQIGVKDNSSVKKANYKTEYSLYDDCNGSIEITDVMGGMGDDNRDNYFYEWLDCGHCKDGWGNDEAYKQTDMCPGEYSVIIYDKLGCGVRLRFFILQAVELPGEPPSAPVRATTATMQGYDDRDLLRFKTEEKKV